MKVKLYVLDRRKAPYGNGVLFLLPKAKEKGIKKIDSELLTYLGEYDLPDSLMMKLQKHAPELSPFIWGNAKEIGILDFTWFE